jgi:hypothetical protein
MARKMMRKMKRRNLTKTIMRTTIAKKVIRLKLKKLMEMKYARAIVIRDCSNTFKI